MIDCDDDGGSLHQCQLRGRWVAAKMKQFWQLAVLCWKCSIVSDSCQIVGMSLLYHSRIASSSQWRCRPPAPMSPVLSDPPTAPSRPLSPSSPPSSSSPTECKVSRLPQLTLPPSLHETGAYLQCTRCRCSPSGP